MASGSAEVVSKYNFEIHPVTDDDLDSFMKPLFGLMGTVAFVSALWPDNQTEEGRMQAKERWLKEMKLHPGIRWIKVVNTKETELDGKTFKIVAVAQWAIFEPGKRYPEVLDLIPEEHWPSETEKEWGTDLWESYIKSRRSVLRKETAHPVLSLQILCTWPEYSRHGIGSMLVQYGCDIANAFNAIYVVESSLMGQPLYMKFGFRVKKIVNLEARERFEDREKGRIIFMVRSRPGEDDYDFPDYKS